LFRHAGWIGAVLALAPGVLRGQVSAPFTPGNLVIFRVGDGVAALSNAATAIFLDEYTPAGVLVRTIAVPSAGGSATTATGNATTEGIVTRSQNGARLVFGGYRKDAGGTIPSSDAPAVTNRVIGTIDLAGTLDTSVGLTDPTASLRSATSVDGISSFYIGTSTSVRYVGTPGAAATSVQIDSRNSRQVVLTGNTLFVSNGSTSITAKVQHYGTLPVGATTATPVVTLEGPDAVNGIWFADLTPAVAGDDTLYLLSTVKNLLHKYTFDSENWTASGSIPAGGAQNLTGIVNGTDVKLFLTSGSSLYAFTDTSEYNGTLSGSLGTAIATAPTNTAFRGIGMFNAAPPAAPTFVGAEFLLNGDVRLTWNGTPGIPPRIEVSDDLATWAPLGTTAETAPGVFQITDSPPAGSRRRFYRALVP
jgi:hypothetical protein